MYYSTDLENWTTWNGDSINSVFNGNEYYLYLRGYYNTRVSYGDSFIFTGSDIKCEGNIETLLNYQQVQKREHPEMAGECFRNMFAACTALVIPPDLPAETLVYGCYISMFAGCTSLTIAPELPAITLKTRCYFSMFNQCSSLTIIPSLPSTTLVYGCYDTMFNDCSSLKFSATKTGTYTKTYRIPISDTGTSVDGALQDMFLRTDGLFADGSVQPEINTTYYLDESCSIVPEPVSETETWVINGTVAISLLSVAIDFTSNDIKFTFISLSPKGNGEGYFLDTDGNTTQVMANGTWFSMYRTVIFDSPVTDATLLAWLQVNAVKQ